MRKPIRRCQVSSGSASAGRQRHGQRRTAAARRGPGATTASGSGTSSRRATAVPLRTGSTVASVAPPTLGARPAAARSTRSTRSTSTCTSTRAVPSPSTVTSGRTAASRAVAPGCSPTGRQMPAVTRSGPSPSRSCRPSCGSTLYGWGLAWGRAPERGSLPLGVRVRRRRSRRRACCRPRRAASPHVEAVGAVLVRGARRARAPLSVDRGDGVQPVEDQVDALAGRRRGQVERRRRSASRCGRSSSAASFSSRYGSGIRPAASRSVCTQPGTVAGTARSRTRRHRSVERAECPAVVQGGHHWRFLGSREGVSSAELSGTGARAVVRVGVPVVSNLIQ